MVEMQYQGDEQFEPVELPGSDSTDSYSFVEEAGFSYGEAAVFDYDTDDEESMEAVGDYLEEEWGAEDRDLFEESIEAYTDLVESDEVEDGFSYLAVDEEEDVMIEYDLDDDPAARYPSITIKKHGMPAGLFGFTRTGGRTQERSVHINDNLYKVDEESTIPHEITHQRFPGKDEMTIRYINGDIDPQNTTSMARFNNNESWGYNPASDSCC